MKGILLAGGEGTRLYPVTHAIPKQLLPLYDKPLIYYPLSVLMLTEIKEILIISTPRDIPLFKNLLGDGAWLGIHLEYAEQDKPRGIADAFTIGKDFIGNDDVALVLGDNVFYGQSFTSILKEGRRTVEKERTSVIFGYYVHDPSSYGVVEFTEDGKVTGIEEKPVHPKSKYAVPGLYFYTNDVITIAQNIKPSARGELEITDINNAFLKKQKLNVKLLGRGMAWLDTGTCDRLLEASNFIATIQKRQGLYVSCIEEIAFRKGWITETQLKKLADGYKTAYGEYLKYIASSEQN